MPVRRAGPGPGAYMLPPTVGAKNHDFTKYKNPEYSMRQRTPLYGKYVTPGPQYDVSKLTRVGKHTPPAYSLSSRHAQLASFKPPGPGTYSPETAPRMKEQRPPAYTMARRYPDHISFNSPGPNQYPLPSSIGPKVPDKPASSAFTMAGRHSTHENDRSPGPAKYFGTDLDQYKPKAPGFSISPRYMGISDKSQSPGPAGYFPKLQGPCNPGFHFGMRTDIDPYVIAEDNIPCIPT